MMHCMYFSLLYRLYTNQFQGSTEKRPSFEKVQNASSLRQVASTSMPQFFSLSLITLYLGAVNQMDILLKIPAAALLTWLHFLRTLMLRSPDIKNTFALVIQETIYLEAALQ